MQEIIAKYRPAEGLDLTVKHIIPFHPCRCKVEAVDPAKETGVRYYPPRHDFTVFRLNNSGHRVNQRTLRPKGTGAKLLLIFSGRLCF